MLSRRDRLRHLDKKVKDMSLDFEKYAAKGNEVINLLSEDLEVPRDMAGRILRSVLHALRNRVSMEASIQFMAQLPMALKSVYVEGWKPPSTYNRIRHLNDFLDEIRKEDNQVAGYDFGDNEKAKQAVKAVLRTLNYFISEGELKDFTSILPHEIRDFIIDTLGEDRIVL